MNTESPTISSTPLLDAFLKLLEGWASAFSQHRTHQRAIRLALAHVLTPGHRMISRLITSCGRQELDWSAATNSSAEAPGPCPISSPRPSPPACATTPPNPSSISPAT